MFSTLVSTIQTALTSLVSKGFVVASLFPACLFVAASLLMMSALHLPLAETLMTLDGDAGQKTFKGAVMMLALITLAYLLSTLSTVMLETLEGRHLSGNVRGWFQQNQYSRVKQMNDRMAEVNNEVFFLAFNNQRQNRDDNLAANLATASAIGPKLAPCAYPAAGGVRDQIGQLEADRSKGVMIPAKIAGVAGQLRNFLNLFDENENSPAAAALKTDRGILSCINMTWEEQLRWASEQQPKSADPAYPAAASPGNIRGELASLERLRARGEPIPYRRLADAVRELRGYLRNNDENLDTQKDLKDGRETLLSLISYSRDRYKYERQHLWNEKQFNYPGQVEGPSDGKSSVNVLAPTRFGNIGSTMRSYALTRYGLDLDLFWSRLQRNIVNSTNDNFPKVMQDTKSQLDCFVALFYLSALSTAFWMVWLLAHLRSPLLFFAIGIAGPIATYAAYLLACQSYSVFADLVRTSVDTYRFGLLTDLHIAPPVGSQEEIALWELLGNRTGYDRKLPVLYLNTNK